MPNHRPAATPRRHHRRAVALVAAVVLALTGAVTVGGSAAGAAPAGGPSQGAAVTGFGEPGVPVRPASERYVRESYRSVLGRGADESGLAYWGGRIDDGLGRGVFASQLVLSGEALVRQVDATYATALDRAPTAAERDAAVSRMKRGRLAPEGLLVELLSSSEWLSLNAIPPDRWVSSLYEDVLGRTPADAERTYWTTVIANGSDPATVARQLAKGIVYSSEYLGRQVDDAYDQLLGRTSDAAGRAYWIGVLRHGQTTFSVARLLLASTEAWGMGCSILDGSRCLLPFPNDQYTLPDPSTETGRRVVFKSAWAPAQGPDVPEFDVTEWNRQDGFSPGSAIMVQSNGIDPTTSGLAPLTDIGASLADDAPIVVVDVDTGERWPYWAELDANAPNDAERALFIRPAKNFLDGHTYAVGIGQVRDASGAAIARPSGFASCLSVAPHPYRRVREQCAPVVDASITVADAGLASEDQYLAWSFTVASTRNLAERIVHMRDEVLGGPAGLAPAPFTVTGTEHRDDGTTRVDGTFEVPKYLTGDGAPGSRLALGDDDLPEADGTYTAPFTCTVPDSALETPGRPSLYGHGLLGTGGQANSGYIRVFATEHDIVLCGTDYLGMAEADVPNTLGILGDLSRFPELVDRNQQGLLNTLVLGRLMRLPDGLVSDPAFQNTSGAPVIATGDEVYYYGNSQGGINGGAVMAIGTDIHRGVLGVPGTNYSTLLQRSVDFDPFFALLANRYPSALDRAIGLSVIQMLWDRGEANGYANHVTSDPLPGTAPSEVLLHVALGDHQVANAAADVMARTYGAATNDPPTAPGRFPDVTPLWGIDRISTWPHAGSATIYWDSGTPAPPVENVPNRAGEDPHGDPRNDPDARIQMSDFLMPGGVVTDQCGGSWCVADGVLTP